MKRLFIYLTLACTALTAWGQSMNELLQKANAGDAQAQYELGYAYYFGANGCEKDYAKAFNGIQPQQNKAMPKPNSA